MFVALKGQHADGAAFARQAIERGAIAVVSQDARARRTSPVPWVVGRTMPACALALLAAAFFGHPSASMQVVGITGTNGKTTTAYLVASIFEAAGIRCGVLGTVGYRIGDEVREATHTTPEAPEVQALLREMVDRGCGACAMEVSSHALSLRRVDGMTFAAGVFTNLTRDHLDFHADMEAYFQAKRRLFEMLPRDAPSLINLDDPRGASLVEIGRPAGHLRRQPPGRHHARAAVVLARRGWPSTCARRAARCTSTSSLVGRPNVYNILAAVSTATALGLSVRRHRARHRRARRACPAAFRSCRGPKTTSRSSSTTRTPTTRCATCSRRRGRSRAGRLITVFGCGGDRDRTKRPLMGAVAGRLSDLIVITSDNPRSEDPARIIEEIQRGITADTRRDTAQRLLTDRRSPRGDWQGDRTGAARRPRAHRRQGARKISDRRQRRCCRSTTWRWRAKRSSRKRSNSGVV